MSSSRWSAGTVAGLTLLLSGGAPVLAQEQPRAPAPPGWIGISYTHDLGPGARVDGVPAAVITAVVRGSPAHRAGLQPGDTILAVDGSPGSPPVLLSLARRLRPGEPVVLTLGGGEGREEVRVVAGRRPVGVTAPPLPPRVVVRLDSVRRALMRNLDSLRLRVRVDPGSRGRAWALVFDSAAAGAVVGPGTDELRGFSFTFSGDSTVGFRFDSEEGLEIFSREAFPPLPADGAEPVVEPEPMPRPPSPWVVGRDYVAGARVTPLNPGLAQYFSVDEGILVTDVLEGTPAGEAGLAAGDVIVSVGDRTPGSVEQLRLILARSGGPVALTVVRKGDRVRLRLLR